MFNIKLFLTVCVSILLIAVIVFLKSSPKTSVSDLPKMSDEEARVIAESTCIKGEESLGNGTFNQNSNTWWYDANLNSTKPGCNPACVVSVETKTAEINWRCTGLIPEPKSITSFEECVNAGNPVMESYPRQCAANGQTFVEEIENANLDGEMLTLFMEKYPKYANTMSVKISQSDATHIRGSISFEPGVGGGIFFAVKEKDIWKIVHEGNGQISCGLKSYGFPQEMLEDCVD